MNHDVSPNLGEHPHSTRPSVCEIRAYKHHHQRKEVSTEVRIVRRYIYIVKTLAVRAATIC